MGVRLSDLFRGKIVLITGAGSGLGRALALELCSYGASVVVSDIDSESLKRVSREISNRVGRVDEIVLDVTDAPRVHSEIARVAHHHSRLDYIFNCAGIGLKGELRDMTEEQWRKLVDVNLWGVIHCTNAAYKVMQSKGSGHIVNIASLAGLVPVPGVAAYGAVKHAVVGLSTAIRAEGAKLGVRVTVVCPGPIATGFSRAMMRAGSAGESGGTTSVGMDPELAARTLLRGVARNRALVVFPLRARLTWLLYRFMPASVVSIQRGIVRRLRAARESTDQTG